jgi:hypothetical protein
MPTSTKVWEPCAPYWVSTVAHPSGIWHYVRAKALDGMILRVGCGNVLRPDRTTAAETVPDEGTACLTCAENAGRVEARWRCPDCRLRIPPAERWAHTCHRRPHRRTAPPGALAR